MITALICLLLSSFALVVVLDIIHKKKWGKFETPKKKIEHQFKPFEEVLVRNYDNDYWVCAVFFITYMTNASININVMMHGGTSASPTKETNIY